MSSNSTPLETKTPQDQKETKVEEQQQQQPPPTPFNLDSNASAFENMIKFKKYCKSHNINLLDDDCPVALTSQFRKLQKDVSREKEANKAYVERLKSTNTKISSDVVDLIQNPGIAEDDKKFNIFVGANRKLLDEQDRRIRELEELNKKNTINMKERNENLDLEPPKKKRKLNDEEYTKPSSKPSFGVVEFTNADTKNMKDIQSASALLRNLFNKERILVPKESAEYTERIINSKSTNTFPSFVNF